MAEYSADSAPKGRKRITKTLPLTLAEALEILTRGFYIVEEAGGEAVDVEAAEQGVVVIRLHGVAFDDGLLVPYTDSSQEAQT